MSFHNHFAPQGQWYVLFQVLLPEPDTLPLCRLHKTFFVPFNLWCNFCEIIDFLVTISAEKKGGRMIKHQIRHPFWCSPVRASDWTCTIIFQRWSTTKSRRLKTRNWIILFSPCSKRKMFHRIVRKGRKNHRQETPSHFAVSENKTWFWRNGLSERLTSQCAVTWHEC